MRKRPPAQVCTRGRERGVRPGCWRWVGRTRCSELVWISPVEEVLIPLGGEDL